MRSTRPDFLALHLPLFLTLSACNPGGSIPPSDDSEPGDLVGDAGLPEGWGEPIDAPPGEWTWVDVAGTRCADGSRTGLAINPSPSDHPSGTVIYMEPGGACWNAVSCGFHWGNVGLALHLEGFDAKTWDGPFGTIYSTMGVFNRAMEDNPFRDANFVFLPYCTGDVFAGRAVKALPTLGGGTRDYHFVGHLNVQAYLARLAPTFPDTERVWLIGSSAGGFGVEMNWELTQEAFAHARVDVISDSGQPIDPPEATWQRWLATWDLWLPPDCADCDLGPAYILEHYLQSDRLAGNKYGLIVFRTDPVISLFFGLSFGRHGTEVDDLLAMLDDPTYPNSGNAFYFARPEPFHTTFLLGWDWFGSEGVQLRDWLTMFVEDDPALTSVGPD